jgi:hypothetical protein
MSKSAKEVIKCMAANLERIKTSVAFIMMTEKDTLMKRSRFKLILFLISKLTLRDKASYQK